MFDGKWVINRLSSNSLEVIVKKPPNQLITKFKTIYFKYTIILDLSNQRFLRRNILVPEPSQTTLPVGISRLRDDAQPLRIVTVYFYIL